MPDPETVALVSCGKSKLPNAAPAHDLYTGQLFQAARAYVEAQGWPWWILSARHGLLDPKIIITPYDVTLLTMRAQERRSWAWDVFYQIVSSRLPDAFPEPPARVVILAGQAYHRYLAPDLRAAGYTVVLPLAGLPGIGSQTAWLKANTPGRDRG